MTNLVRGSLQDMANNSRKPISQVFLNCDVVILVDVSGSMDEADCGGRKRFDVANEQLIILQRNLPGKIAVVPWNHDVSFQAGGLPTDAMGGTDLVKALKFIKPIDGCGMKIIVISDGFPSDPNGALQLAATFHTKLDTIYIGPEGLSGTIAREFMRKLAEVSGGIAVSQSVKQIGLLNETVGKLLKA